MDLHPRGTWTDSMYRGKNEEEGGARGVMVIDVGNGYDDTSSNP